MIHRILAMLTASLALASASIAQESPVRIANIAGITADSFRAVRQWQPIKVLTVDDVVIEGRFFGADSAKGALLFHKRPEPILFENVDLLYTRDDLRVPFGILGAVAGGVVVPFFVGLACWGIRCTRVTLTPVVLVGASIGGFAGARVGSGVRNWKLRYSRL